MTKKLVSMLAVALMMVSMLVACGVKMADTYDEQAVKDKAVEVVNLLNEGNQEAVLEMYRAQERVITDTANWPVMETIFVSTGLPKEISKISVKTEKGQMNDEPTAVVTVVANCENGTIKYNVIFDGNNEVLGWHLSDQKKNLK